MAFSVMKTAAAYAFVVLCVLDVSVARVLTGERWLPVPAERVSVSMAMLRAPVPPSGRNPCSFIPRQGRGRCTLSEVEDGADGASSAFPGMNVDGFAAASMVNQTQKQDHSLSS